VGTASTAAWELLSWGWEAQHQYLQLKKDQLSSHYLASRFKLALDKEAIERGSLASMFKIDLDAETAECCSRNENEALAACHIFPEGLEPQRMVTDFLSCMAEVSHCH
jgi:hypothetical protein